MSGFLGMSEQMATFVIALCLQIVPLFALVFYAVFWKRVDDSIREEQETMYSETGKSSTNYGVANGFMRPQSRGTSFYGDNNDAAYGYERTQTFGNQLTGVSRGSTTGYSLERRKTSDVLLGDLQAELSLGKIKENCGAFLILSATVASTGIFHYTDFASDLGSTVTYYQAAGDDNSTAVSEDHRYGFFFSSIFFILLYRFISTWFFYKARFPTAMCIRQFFDIELYRQVYESMWHNRYTKAMVYIKRFESVFEAFPQAMIALWFLLLTTKKDPVVLVSLLMSIWSIASSLSWSDDTAFKPHAYYGGFWWLRTTLRICEVTSRLFVLAYCAVAFSPIFLLGILLFDFFSSWAIHLWDKYVHSVEWRCCFGCGLKRCFCCSIQTHSDYNEELQTRNVGHIHKHVASYFKSIDNVLMFLIAVPSFSKDQLYIYMYAVRISMCVFCAGLSITYSELSREAGISEVDQVWVLFIGFCCLIAEVFLIYKIKNKVISEGGGDTIFKAARTNDVDKVLDDIQFGGVKIVGNQKIATVNKLDRNNMKALHHAAAGGHIYLVKVLSQKMIDIEKEVKNIEKDEDLSSEEKREIVDCKDLHGNTPINFSITEGHEDALRVLLNFKADPRGWSGFKEDTGKALIHEAAERGFGRICENLVELPAKGHKEDVNRAGHFRSWTPLMFACRKAGPIVYPFRNKVRKEDDEEMNGNDEKLVDKAFKCQQLMGLMIEITHCEGPDVNEETQIPDVICCFHENHNIKQRRKKSEVGLITGVRMRELLSSADKRKEIKSKCFNLGEVTWDNVWNPDEELWHKFFFKTAAGESLAYDIRPHNLGTEQELFLDKEKILIKFVIMDRYVHCVRELLRMGANTVAKGTNQETAMGLALRSRKMNVVSMILNSRLESELVPYISRSEWKLASLNSVHYEAMLQYEFPPQFPRLKGMSLEGFLDIHKRSHAPPTLIRQPTKSSDAYIPVRGAASPKNQGKYDSALPDAYGVSSNDKWANAKRLAEEKVNERV